jgi:molybdopterin-guanine dinucleotide biosynthesis protein A
MLGRAIAALSPCCTEVVIVSSRSGDGVGAWRVIPDLREASGPLGGIEAALTRAAAEGFDGVFVLACDLPLVDVSIVRAVLDAWVDTPCVAPAREGTPDIEPLCAVYGTECVATVRRLLDAGERRAWMLFEHEDGVRVPIDSTRLMNVNTQADLAVAQAKVTELEPNGGAGS